MKRRAPKPPPPVEERGRTSRQKTQYSIMTLATAVSIYATTTIEISATASSRTKTSEIETPKTNELPNRRGSTPPKLEERTTTDLNSSLMENMCQNLRRRKTSEANSRSPPGQHESSKFLETMG